MHPITKTFFPETDSQPQPASLSFETLFSQFQIWARTTFEKTTALSSLKKMESELRELRTELSMIPADSNASLLAEYVDVFMCLLHSMDRAGIHILDFQKMFEWKMVMNFTREWELNPDGNTYSHVKNPNIVCKYNRDHRGLLFLQNGPHIESRCAVCNSHIKFINPNEKKYYATEIGLQIPGKIETTESENNTPG